MLKQLWRILPVEDRQRMLRALSRVIAQQLASAPAALEVADERP